MPQLDKVTFLSQFFWLCVFFLGFYVVALKHFLPQMSRILKYRKKRLSQSHHGVNTMQQENTKVRSSAEKLLESGLKNSKEMFKQNRQRTEDWLFNLTNQTNQTKLKDTNYAYLRSLGERSLSHNLSLQGGFIDFSNTVFVSVLTQKLNQSFLLKRGHFGNGRQKTFKKTFSSQSYGNTSQAKVSEDKTKKP